MNAESAVKKALQCAASFLTHHTKEKGVGPTFAYFVKHPVAPLNKKRLAILLNHLESHSKKLGRPLRVLDLACGGGLITCAVAMMGHRALGVDISHEEIHLAKLFAQEELLDGIFLQADLIQDADWEQKAELTLGGKPDVVTLAYALHHFPNIDIFMKRLSQWVAPGCLLLVNEENPESPLFRLKHRVRTWIQKDTETEWHRTFGGWSQLLESHGFKLVPPLVGTDLVPALNRFKPALCWSLVFTAQRG